MTQSRIKTGLLIAIFLFVTQMSANAAPSNMYIAGETNPPIGHYEFCRIHRDQCSVVGYDHGPMALSEASWNTLLQVNYTVNSEIQPLTDEEIYGVEERWAYPVEVGDCEDYVLLKRKMLMQAGFSAANLLITVVVQPNGEGHAVLTVRTDHGDFVLDNMRNKVLLWFETEYTFLKRQSSEDSGRWVMLDSGQTTAVGSVK